MNNSMLEDDTPGSTRTTLLFLFLDVDLAVDN